MFYSNQDFLVNLFMPDNKLSNRLSKANSPYLKQHANNPVAWQSWNKETLQLAKDADKPMLISIGYSACHWCHVMEHESFEDNEVAEVLNTYFIPIKIDREELPDVDMVYMEAVQAMGLQGGWPLNVFATPDGKPFYGGTYFPKPNFLKILDSISSAWINHRVELEQSAKGFEEGINRNDLARYGLHKPKTSAAAIVEHRPIFERLVNQFDYDNGGLNRVPKFPLPSIWDWLLFFCKLEGSSRAQDHLDFTLSSIAKGGIFDHLGGGFSRYSVDAEWLVPHFEKMLYDNGQLLSLYAQAYFANGNKEYLTTINSTGEWLEREMRHKNGAFYAALDADSEGVEGKFYVWSVEEVSEVLDADAELFIEYYGLTEEGNFEGENILFKSMSDEAFAVLHHLNEDEWQTKLRGMHRRLLAVRDVRVRPGLDHKVIASWNGMAIKGLCQAWLATEDERWLDLATDSAEYFMGTYEANGALHRIIYDDGSKLPALLEDYAFLAEGFIQLYQSRFNEKYLSFAKQLVDEAIQLFYDDSDGFFWVGQENETLFARKKELFDNVIPSSNSCMAICLWLLGNFYYEEDYLTLSKRMVATMKPIMEKDIQFAGNWGKLSMLQQHPFIQIAIVGNTCLDLRQELETQFLPNKVVAGCEALSEIPVLNGKYAINGQPTIYVCHERTCSAPVHSVEEAFEQIKVLLPFTETDS